MAEINPFTANGLPTTLNPEAQRTIGQKSVGWFLAHILANLAGVVSGGSVTVSDAPVTVVPGSTSTSATGATWTLLGNQAATLVRVENDGTGTALELRYVATPGTSFSLYDNTFDTYSGITNLSQIEFRRKDLSNTQVSIKWRAQQ